MCVRQFDFGARACPITALEPAVLPTTLNCRDKPAPGGPIPGSAATAPRRPVVGGGVRRRRGPDPAARQQVARPPRAHAPRY